MLSEKNFINKIGVIHDSDWELVTEKVEESLNDYGDDEEVY